MSHTQRANLAGIIRRVRRNGVPLCLPTPNLPALWLLCLTLLLAGCGEDTGICLTQGAPQATPPPVIKTIQANGLQTTIQFDGSKTVAYGQWVNTGIMVNLGDNTAYQTSVTGVVYLCPTVGMTGLDPNQGETISTAATSTAAAKGLTGTFDRGKNYQLNSATRSFSSSITVHRGDDLRILFAPDGDTWNDGTSHANRWQPSGTGTPLINGAGITIQIGNDTPLSAAAMSISNLINTPQYGVNYIDLSSVPALYQQEMRDGYGIPSAPQGSSTGYPGAGGTLSFVFNGGNSHNQGTMTAYVQHGACKRTNGQNLWGQVTNGIPSDTGPLIDMSASSITPSASPGQASMGMLWVKIASSPTDPSWFSRDPASYTGSYKLSMAATSVFPSNNVMGTFSSTFSTIAGYVQSNAQNFINSAFVTFQGPTIANAIYALITLYIIIISVLYMFGATQMNQKTLVITLLKMAIILMLISPNSATFFQSYFLGLFTDGSTYLTSILTDASGPNANGGVSNSNSKDQFAFLNAPFEYMLNGTMLLRVMAFFANANPLSMPLTIIMLVLIIQGIVQYITAVYEALLSYVLAILAMTMLLAVAPLFLSFMLFESTKSLFNSWLRITVRFALEPAIMFAGLVILSELAYQTLYDALDFAICNACILDLSFGLLTSIGNICIYGYQVVMDGSDTLGGAAIAILQKLIVFAIFSQFISKFSGEFMKQTMNTLTASSPFMGASASGKAMAQGQKGALISAHARVQQFGGEKYEKLVAGAERMQMRVMQNVKETVNFGVAKTASTIEAGAKVAAARTVDGVKAVPPMINRGYRSSGLKQKVDGAIDKIDKKLGVADKFTDIKNRGRDLLSKPKAQLDAWRVRRAINKHNKTIDKEKR